MSTNDECQKHGIGKMRIVAIDGERWYYCDACGEEEGVKGLIREVGDFKLGEPVRAKADLGWRGERIKAGTIGKVVAFDGDMIGVKWEGRDYNHLYAARLIKNISTRKSEEHIDRMLAWSKQVVDPADFGKGFTTSELIAIRDLLDTAAAENFAQNKAVGSVNYPKLAERISKVIGERFTAEQEAEEREE